MEQGTAEWHAARLGKVTASMIANVMMKPTAAGYQNYKAQLVCERLTGNPTETFTSAAMQHGTETEPQARAFYEMQTGLDVVEVGFVDHPFVDMSGASPDGLVGEAGLVEIKCPQQPKHIKALMGGNPDRNYMLQMHWQMMCTERGHCDFVSFNPTFPAEMQMDVVRVDLNATLAQEILEAVERFVKDVDQTAVTLADKYGIKELSK